MTALTATVVLTDSTGAQATVTATCTINEPQAGRWPGRWVLLVGGAQ